MKRKKRIYKPNDHCDGCVWVRKDVDKDKKVIYCPLQRCIKDEALGRKVLQWRCVEEVPRSFSPE